jgi:hypothetical protein
MKYRCGDDDEEDVDGLDVFSWSSGLAIALRCGSCPVG